MNLTYCLTPAAVNILFKSRSCDNLVMPKYSECGGSPGKPLVRSIEGDSLSRGGVSMSLSVYSSVIPEREHEGDRRSHIPTNEHS